MNDEPDLLAALDRAIDELRECRTLIRVETRHQATVDHLTEVIHDLMETRERATTVACATPTPPRSIRERHQQRALPRP